jgi:hypothetical protein
MSFKADFKLPSLVYQRDRDDYKTLIVCNVIVGLGLVKEWKHSTVEDPRVQ